MSDTHTIQTILTALNETDDRPRSQITAIVRVLGVEQALAILVEANEIEATGGMMLPDGSRRRTPGGVYFALARRRLSAEDREAIFPRSNPPKKSEAKPAPEQRPAEQRPAEQRASEARPAEQRAPQQVVSARPDRRHVRLISPAEPVRVRPSTHTPYVEPPRANGALAASTESARAAQNGASAQTATETVSNGSGEVKLVRLDRRRIVQLPPLPPPPEPEPVKRKTRGPGRGARRSAETEDTSQMHLPLQEAKSEPASVREPPLPKEPAQIRKRVVALLGALNREQKRLMLIDLLAEFSEGPKSSKQPPPKKEEPDMRGRVLAAVGNRLELPVGLVAATIFGADTPNNRRKVKVLASAKPAAK